MDSDFLYRELRISRVRILVVVLALFSWASSVSSTLTCMTEGPSSSMEGGGFFCPVPFITPEVLPRCGLISYGALADWMSSRHMSSGMDMNLALDKYDLVRFIKLVQQAGLSVHLRISPCICAEWNFGGFPVCLKYVPGIEFGTDDQPFKNALQGFTQKIVNMMMAEKFFESQGGPIILSQIENEFGPVEWEIGAPGKAYTQWAANMAAGLGTRVPCKQEDAPDPVVRTNS